MYSTDNQIDFILQSIIRSEQIANYSYKNGTRVKKGYFYKDEKGVERFKHVADYSYISVEPWPLKLSRTLAKDLLKIPNVGDKKL
jgi:hypothetical protein